MTKNEIKTALKNAEILFNERINEQCRHIDDDKLKVELEQFASAVLDCFGDFEKIITELGN